MGSNFQRVADSLQCLLHFPPVLLQTGYRDVLGHRLVAASLFLEDQRQTGMRQLVIRVDARYPRPGVYGFVYVSGTGVQLCGAQGGLDSLLRITQMLQDFSNPLQGDGVIGSVSGSPGVILQRFGVLSHLVKRQPKIAQCQRMIGNLFQRLPVKSGSPFPILVPGCGMSLVHQFAKAFLISCHTYLPLGFYAACPESAFS